jgi:hypothetical protein
MHPQYPVTSVSCDINPCFAEGPMSYIPPQCSTIRCNIGVQKVFHLIDWERGCDEQPKPIKNIIKKNKQNKRLNTHTHTRTQAHTHTYTNKQKHKLGSIPLRQPPPSNSAQADRAASRPGLPIGTATFTSRLWPWSFPPSPREKWQSRVPTYKWRLEDLEFFISKIS